VKLQNFNTKTEREKGSGHEAAPVPILFLVHQMSASILLVATFVRLGAERLLFAVADGFDAIPTHSSLDERILDRIRAIRA
jgi:uncharacterized membrane protein